MNSSFTAFMEQEHTFTLTSYDILVCAFTFAMICYLFFKISDAIHNKLN
jgi:hypothetical protein